ncbi:MAG TPA: TatD family hydrolase [Candidatus Binataceae bacterium]|nr:TatD family hydrolase [Candidatus Binataceae bacterium]
MNPLIDTHCHLADPKLHGELDAVLERARAAGIGTIVSVGAISDIATDRLTVEIAERHENIYAVVGVHPHDAKDCDANRIGELRELARSKRVVAIGESGLDFHYMHSPAQAQEESLRRHLELAGELELPIVIHCRNAEKRLAEIVREAGMPSRGGVIHCFTGNREAALEFLALGFHISFSGIVTFRSARELHLAAPVVPDDRVMVETDAPYLAPEPYRGKRNEPAFVRRTLEALAKLRGVEADRLATLTTENARRFFRLE